MPGSRAETTRSRTGGVALAALVVATTLFWWASTDRLDLPKQVVLVAGSLGLAAWNLIRSRGRPDLLSLALALATLAALALSTSEMAARVEGWAGLLAALAVVGIARRTPEPALAPWLARLAVCLAAVAWLQALGAGLFNSGLAGFEGRRVTGTLGGPGHLGWVLALLLPWAGSHLGPLSGATRIRRVRDAAMLALVAGAIVLSGSRTAWVMALVGLPLWLGRRQLLPVCLALLLGVLSAFGADAATGRARLGDRVSDLAATSGTAAGRVYLWRVHLSAISEMPLLGRGPEGFQRAWPAWQHEHLERHPEQAGFRSDLRHAHADPVEVASDYGLPGLLLGIYLVVLGLLRRPRRGPALAGLVATIAGGTAASLLFFAPTLCLAAVCLGVRLGPVRRPLPGPASIVLVLALAAACIPLGIRLTSEVVRSEATLAHAQNRLAPARAAAEQSADIDSRNPRAWIQLGMTCERLDDGACRRHAYDRASRDLPADGVLTRTDRPPGR